MKYFIPSRAGLEAAKEIFKKFQTPISALSVALTNKNDAAIIQAASAILEIIIVHAVPGQTSRVTAINSYAKRLGDVDLPEEARFIEELLKGRSTEDKAALVAKCLENHKQRETFGESRSR